MSDRPAAEQLRPAAGRRRPPSRRRLSAAGSAEIPQPAGLSASERRLLSDLFAIVSEHAADSAVEIDRARVQDAFVFACEHHAAQRRKSGRGVHRAPGRRGADLREHAPRHRDAVRRAAARHRRGHLGLDRGGAGALRRGDLERRRRRHEAEGDHLPVARRGAGEQLPQDDGRDGHRRAGHPDQARRPPAQHAHDRGDVQAEADREGARDARDLRAAGAPPGYPRDQVGARGPRLRDAPPAQVPGDQGAGGPAARRARTLRRRGRRLPARRAARGRHRRADRRPRQALLLDLLEDDQEGPRVQRDLRPDGDARDRRLGEGLLRHGRRDPLAVEAAARAASRTSSRCPSSTCTSRCTRP